MSFDELLKIPSESQFDIMSFYGSKVKEDEGDDNYKICSLANESGTGEFAIYKVLPGIRVVYNDINMLIGWHQEYQWMQMNNCLLYTSPSPRDLSTSRMPSSA